MASSFCCLHWYSNHIFLIICDSFHAYIDGGRAWVVIFAVYIGVVIIFTLLYVTHFRNIYIKGGSAFAVYIGIVMISTSLYMSGVLPITSGMETQILLYMEGERG